ncbi:MAG: HU family DNA-binding protein [Planctomycetota bacterium]
MAKRTAKKATRKKTVRRTTKKPAARSAASPRPTRITSAPKPRTKSEVMTIISEHVGISKKEVAGVFEVMGQMIAADLKRGKAEAFTVPGMMKVTVQRKPATKARKGVNPFTGEEMMFKPKPARNVVKVRPMKGLKDLVG